MVLEEGILSNCSWYVVLVNLVQYKLLVTICDKDVQPVLLSVYLYTVLGTGLAQILLTVPTKHKQVQRNYGNPSSLIRAHNAQATSN